MSLNELADALDSYAPDGDGYNTEYSHNLQEAAALLRAAAGADVEDLIAQIHGYAKAIEDASEVPADRTFAERSDQLAALQARLRLLVAQLQPIKPLAECKVEDLQDQHALVFGRVKVWHPRQEGQDPEWHWSKECWWKGLWYSGRGEPSVSAAWGLYGDGGAWPAPCNAELTHFQPLPPAPKEPS